MKATWLDLTPEAVRARVERGYDWKGGLAAGTDAKFLLDQLDTATAEIKRLREALDYAEKQAGFGL